MVKMVNFYMYYTTTLSNNLKKLKMPKFQDRLELREEWKKNYKLLFSSKLLLNH